MTPSNLDELVVYKHYYTGGRRAGLDDYVDAEEVVVQR